MASKEDRKYEAYRKALLAKNPKEKIRKFAGLGKNYRGISGKVYKTKDVMKDFAETERMVRAKDRMKNRPMAPLKRR